MAVNLDGFCRGRGAGPSEGCVLSVKPEQLLAFWGCGRELRHQLEEPGGSNRSPPAAEPPCARRGGHPAALLAPPWLCLGVRGGRGSLRGRVGSSQLGCSFLGFAQSRRISSLALQETCVYFGGVGRPPCRCPSVGLWGVGLAGSELQAGSGVRAEGLRGLLGGAAAPDGAS